MIAEIDYEGRGMLKVEIYGPVDTEEAVELAEELVLSPLSLPGDWIRGTVTIEDEKIHDPGLDPGLTVIEASGDAEDSYPVGYQHPS